MNVFLTGGTGYIGSSVLRHLISAGHSVTALVRSEAKAAAVEAAGAAPLVGDLTDAGTLERAALESDGVIHTASPGDESSGSVNDLAVGAIVSGLNDSAKPFLFTGGIWTYGSNADISEDSAPNPAELAAWRPPIEKWVRGVEGMRPIVVCPAVVYGEGKGLPNVITGGRADDGLHLVGDGSQHWTSVHVDDLAELYVLALENGEQGACYIGASGQNPTVRELGEAAAEAAGVSVVPETAAETRIRIGALLADALLLDQQATGSTAKIELGWEPNGPALVDELRSGSYAPVR